MIVDYSKPAPFSLEVVEEPIIVGQDFEFADITNPQGYIWGSAFYIMAVDRRGQVKTLATAFADAGDAGRFAAGLDGWSPLADDWDFSRAVYGSEAYCDGGYEEDMIAIERREYA